MTTAVGLTTVMILLVTGCSTTQQVAVTDQPGICAFLGEICHELQPGAPGEAGLRWVNPTSDPTRYHQVMVEVVGFFGTDPSKVPPADQERLTALFQQSLTEALATKYQVVDRPAPGTMEVQVIILDAEAATPGLRSVSMAILPVPAGSTVAHLGMQAGKDGKLRLIDLDDMSGQGGPAHVGGEIQLIDVPQGGNGFPGDRMREQPAVWVDPADHSAWVFAGNGSGLSGLQLGLDVYEGAYTYRGMHVVPGWGGSMFEELMPDVFVDVTDHLDRKLEAMALYETELRAYPHPRSVEALRDAARRWGAVVGVGAAEAFQLVRSVR